MPPPPRLSRRRASIALVALAVIALGLAAGWWADAFGPARDHTVELRSWVVAGRGRHLFAEIVPPGGRHEGTEARRHEVEQSGERGDARAWPGHLPLIVEYWSTALRDDYSPPRDLGLRDRIARMPLGKRVTPALVVPPDNRLEATYRVTRRQAVELARDRVFERRYFLLGPNSSSGLRAAFEQAGLRLPARVLASGGALGEFPGINLSAGREAPQSRWRELGLGGGGGDAPTAAQPAAPATARGMAPAATGALSHN